MSIIRVFNCKKRKTVVIRWPKHTNSITIYPRMCTYKTHKALSDRQISMYISSTSVWKITLHQQSGT